MPQEKPSSFTSFPKAGISKSKDNSDSRSKDSSRKKRKKERSRKNITRSPNFQTLDDRKSYAESSTGEKRLKSDNMEDFSIDISGDWEALRYEAPNPALVPRYDRKYRPGSQLIKKERNAKEYSIDSPVILNEWKDWEILPKTGVLPEIGSVEPTANFISVKGDSSAGNGEEKDKTFDKIGFFKVQEELNRNVNENPSSVKDWVKLIEFQDDYRKYFMSQDSMSQVHEKKLAILEKALHHNPLAYELFFRYISLKSEEENPQNVADAWKQKIEKEPDNLLWYLGYLAYLQNSSEFNYQFCKSAIENTISSHANALPPAARVTLCVRAIWLDAACGYRERAIAIMLNSLNLLDIDEELFSFDALGKFWDNGGVTIGFGKYLPPESASQEGGWDIIEVSHGANSFPVRSIDAFEDIDPDSVILFDEIRDCLVRPSNFYESCVLVQALLSLFGIYCPLPYSTEGTRLDESYTPWLCEEIYLCYPLQFEILLYSAAKFQKPIEISPKQCEFLDNFFAALIAKDKGFVPVYVYYKFRVNESSAFALLNRLLKENAEDNFLQTIFAYICALLGKYETLFHITEDILSNEAFISKNSSSVFGLIRIAVEFALEDSSLQDRVIGYLAQLFSLPSKNNVSLEKLLARLDSVDSHDINILCLSVYLSFIRSGYDEAIKKFDNFMVDKISRCSNFMREQFCFLYSKFIYRYFERTKSQKPRLARDLLLKIWKKFPKNSVILDHFVRLDRKFKTESGKRDLLKEGFEGAKCLEYWAARWNRELYFCERLSSQGIQSFLNEAINHEIARSCPKFWEIYLKSNRENLSKEILFKAISKCPSIKAIHLFAFTQNCPLTEEEKLDIYNIMLDRELRIHEEFQADCKTSGG